MAGILKNTFLIICLALFFQGQSQHIRFNPELEEAFQWIVELRLKEAAERVDSLEKLDPGNKAHSYVRGIIISTKLFLSEDKNDFDKKREYLEKYIEDLESGSDEDPQKRRMISEIRLSMAILHAKYQNHIRAGLQFYKAYNLLEENYEKFPDYAPTYLPLGVINAAIGSLPEGYQSIASLFGITGEVEKGMLLINKGYWRTISEKETRFYKDYFASAYVYAVLKIQGNNYVSLKTLGVDYTKSSYLIYVQSLVEVDKGNAREALNILTHRPEGNQYYDYHFLDYYTGKVAVSFSADTAQAYLNKFLNETPDESFKKSSYRYLSWCAMLKGDKKNLNRYRQLVLDKGNLSTGADRQAQREAESSFNEVLIRGRILFDGGRYADGIQYLKSKKKLLSSFSKTEVLEYHYRLGRIYQENKNIEAAIAEFELASNMQLASATFAQGNSSLQLAKIYEDQKKLSRAKKYFEKTLSLKDFPFYEGLHQQAKAGLDRIK